MRNPRNDPLGSGSTRASGAKATSPRRSRASGPDMSGADGDGSERKCILTGQHGERAVLIRLALGPDGQIAPDVLARAPGRGAWIGVARADLEIAVANGKLRGALARAFKGAALTIPADLGQRTEMALLRAFTDRLGMESKAGNLLLGTERIAQGARAGAVTWLAHASDAGSDGPNKLAQAWRVGEEAEGTGLKGVILPLDRAALSVALGRDNVVHLALTDSAAAQRVAAPLERLLHFLGRTVPASSDMTGQHGFEDRSEGDALAAAHDDIDTKGE